MSLSLAPLVEQLLTWIAEYGLGALGLSLFLAAAGVPLPSTLFVIAAGAFVRQGVFDPVATFVCMLGCVVLGDAVSYGIGRFARTGIERRFGRRRTWLRAKRLLLERGVTAIFLTRWMLTAFAAPTNLAAGSVGYPFRRFLAVDLAGELTWILLYGGLGLRLRQPVGGRCQPGRQLGRDAGRHRVPIGGRSVSCSGSVCRKWPVVRTGRSVANPPTR